MEPHWYKPHLKVDHMPRNRQPTHFSFINLFYLPVCFLKLERRLGIGRVRSGEDLEDEGGETMIRMYSLYKKKFVFNQNKKKSVGGFRQHRSGEFDSFISKIYMTSITVKK